MAFGGLAVRALGGVWAVKSRYNGASNWLACKIYGGLFRSYMSNRGSFIGLSAHIVSPPVFPHDIVGVFISGGACIGKDCTIFHQVTIGSNTLADSRGRGSPRIGNNVYIGAGAKIIGNVTVGDNVRIGANAVVVKDIPDNSVVVCQPTRVIRRPGIVNRFDRFSNKESSDPEMDGADNSEPPTE